MALTSGTLKLPKLAWSDYNLPNWRPRGWPWVDPLKDAQANILQLMNNTDTLENICAESGDDWEHVLRQRAKEIKVVKALGLDTMLNPTKPKAPGSGSQPDGDLAEEGKDGDTTNEDDADAEADAGNKKE
jgi:capsid protein